MATVEERVERLEQQAAQRLDAQLDAGLRATAYGISLVQADVAGVKADLAEVRSDVIGLGSDVAELKTDVVGLREQTSADFAAVNTKLDAILARLPG